MNKKISMKDAHRYRFDGMEVITYLLATITVFIISYSIYVAFLK